MERGWVRSAHDVSDGGLAVTLPEMAFGGGLGFSVDLKAVGVKSPGTALVAEGASRFVVEVRESDAPRWERAFRGLASRRLGTVRGHDGELGWGAERRATVLLGPLYERWRYGLGLPG